MGPNANSTNATPFSFLCQFSHKSGMKQLSGKPAAVVSVPPTQPASQPTLAQHRTGRLHPPPRQHRTTTLIISLLSSARLEPV